MVDKVLSKCLEIDPSIAQIKTYFDQHQDDALWQSFLIYNLMLDITRKEKLFENLPIKKDLIDTWVRKQI